MTTTVAQIKDRLRHQKYQNYVVTDIGTFPWCVARTDAGEAALLRYNNWKQGASATQQPLLLNPRLATAKTFINATKNTAKVAECSNFAYHAIGVLLGDEKIAQQYNICLAGIMGNRHNIAVLFPKDLTIDEEQLKQGVWPKGTLIVDPWAVGMGHSAEHALAVPVSGFVFQNSMQPFVIHYQSKNDETIEQSKEQGADITNPLTEFVSLVAVPAAMQEEYHQSQFDIHLDDIKKKALDLHRRGYVGTFHTAVELYNKIAGERNNFMGRPLTEASKKQFSDNTERLIIDAQKSELSHFRGFTKYLFGLLNTLIYLVTGNESRLYTTKTASKIAELDKALSFFKPQPDRVSPESIELTPQNDGPPAA